MGNDNFHRKRKERNTRRIREEKKSVLISLEDTKSSKYYFEELLKDKGLKGKITFADHIGTNPAKVLEALKKYKDKNTHEKFEKEWIVFDKDSYRKDEIDSVVTSAKQKGVCIAFSNESYELWIILHFEKLERWTTREELNKKLKKIFKDKYGKEYKKSSKDIYKMIIGMQGNAITNAKNLYNMHDKNGKLSNYGVCNPMTTMYKLVEYLNALRK